LKINPPYVAPEQLHQYINPELDYAFALQRVDPLFDQQFNDKIFASIAGDRPVRTFYVLGHEVGDSTNEGRNRFYLQVC
jgi:hypothetical protein